MRAALVAAAALLAAGAWRLYANPANAAEGEPSDVFDPGPGMLDEAVSALSSVGDWLMGKSAMRQVSPDMLNDANVRAFLMVIRTGEGTADAGGYSRLYGGGSFQGYGDHPRKKITAGRWTSTAAGAYQALASTWDETRDMLGLPDFSPASQDLFALARIAYRGALGDVLYGNFAAAIAKCAREWASLPGSPYGQPTISMAKADAVYQSFGGSYA